MCVWDLGAGRRDRWAEKAGMRGTLRATALAAIVADSVVGYFGGEEDLGHRAFRSSSRFLVPVEEVEIPDQAAWILVGLAEGARGFDLSMDRRASDAADEGLEAHGLACVIGGPSPRRKTGSGTLDPVVEESGRSLIASSDGPSAEASGTA